MNPDLSLNRYQAFEAAARNLSFSQAARELNVLQPAISRQIAVLESELETALFVRTKPRLTLTADGEALYAAVANGLEVIRSAANTIRQKKRENVVVVNAAIGFTSLYLLPRLGDFQSRYPDVKLQIVTRDQNPDFDPRECDCAIVFGRAGLRNAPSTMVLKEELVPVCAPGYLAGDRQIAIGQLAQHDLLHLTSVDHADDWHLYFRSTGIPVKPPLEGNRFHSYMVYLHAIQNGNGIGLGWGRLVDSQLANRTLVLACGRRITTERGYFCSLTKRGVQSTAARSFADWIGTRLHENG